MVFSNELHVEAIMIRMCETLTDGGNLIDQRKTVTEVDRKFSLVRKPISRGQLGVDSL